MFCKKLNIYQENTTFSEPVGYKAPTLSSDFSSTGLKKRANGPIVLLCQSQGYPVPDFRWELYQKYLKTL